MEILAIDKRTNAQLMAQCMALGYLDGIVCDSTYGLGAFWRDVQPTTLLAFDNDPGCNVTVADARMLPLADKSVDSVVFDPPYKLNGTSTGLGASAADHRYGVAGEYQTAHTRHSLLIDGTIEAIRVARRYVLVKCADQISSGKYNPQTFMVWQCATTHDAKLVDLMHVVGMRAQPGGTRQLHSRRNYSSLLIFRVLGCR